MRRKFLISALAVSRSCINVIAIGQIKYKNTWSCSQWFRTLISEASAGFPESMVVTVVRAVSADAPDPIVDLMYLVVRKLEVCSKTDSASGSVAINSNESFKTPFNWLLSEIVKQSMFCQGKVGRQNLKPRKPLQKRQPFRS